ncbi:MAG: hypothetical protein EU549_03990 [Promethearchaeota archaeon]|nr:MAG: hypothetical protein EU549_03990 [Candidatus Lokiarchaeota archaeon]
MRYSGIYQIWEEQLENKDFIELKKDFYKDVGKIIKDFNIEIEKLDRNSIHRQLVQKEIDNIKNMVKSLYIYRFERIIEVIKQGIDIDVTKLTENELELYNNTKKNISKYLNNINLILEGQSIQLIEKKISSKYIIVRFLKALPEIASHEKTYGPFKKEDIVTLPKEIAKTLLDRGAVVLIPYIKNSSEA